MEDFFKSARFKALAGLLIVVLFFMLHAAKDQTTIPIVADIVGTVMTPIQRAATQVTTAVGETVRNIFNASDIAKENESLRLEIDELNQRLVEFDRYKNENDRLKESLGIKEKNPDFDLETAMVIGRDTGGQFFSCTIDKGSSDGIKAGDPVITSGGLVGIVSEVGLNHAKVTTILDATISVGAMDTATREIGSVSGTVELSLDGKCKMSYLPRETSASEGDLVVTTGIGGLYPKELVIGKIESIQAESHGLSFYAVLQPMFDIRTVKDVLVIKRFEGQAES